MNILMASVHFYPSIGGIEIVTENLAKEFTVLGHKVTVVTTTPISPSDHKDFTFTVLRNPSMYELFLHYQKCDIFIHQGISLKWVWPLFFKHKPWVIVYHQVHYPKNILGHIKKICSHFSHAIAVSQTSAKGHNLKKAKVIYNAYDDNIFHTYNFNTKRKNFVFVGRISKEKGCYVLLNAFAKYKKYSNNDSQLTLIGDGNEKEDIEKYSQKLHCHKDIHFIGFKSPCEITQILNEHKVMIVPTTYPCIEAFGLVVLEGLACGCIVIGSSGDGIEEALNKCGYIFPNGDYNKLANCMKSAENLSEEEQKKLREKANIWLKKRTLHKVASTYIDEFNKYINLKK